tara:strand:+ start:28 stop:489 length:462 start_codon:yes stop_codon:yes gene_type:complete
MTVRITSYGSLIGTWAEISEYIHQTAQDDEQTNKENMFGPSSHLYVRLKNLSPEGQAFFQALATDTSLTHLQLEHIFAIIMGPKPAIDEDDGKALANPRSIYNAAEFLLSDPSAASVIGLTGTHISEMQQAWKKHPLLKTIAPSQATLDRMTR